LLIQSETGKSSWFGFSLVIRPGCPTARPALVRTLHELGFECRPIVTGNFAKNPVLKYFDFEIAGSLQNADRVDSHGLFIGNHHFPIDEAIEAVASMRL
jgi:CDP-6-deoxy-D-xylo-4-hexulose-3-dehydrase